MRAAPGGFSADNLWRKSGMANQKCPGPAGRISQEKKRRRRIFRSRFDKGVFFASFLAIPMNPISTGILLEALHWRYATKKFDPVKKIPADIWAALEQALVLAPSSYGLQPWKFVVVQDAATRQKLSAASWGQTQPAECSHYVVFAVRKNLDADHVGRYIDRIVEVRGGTRDALNGFRDIMVGSLERARTGGRLDVWQSHQVYIALGQFLTSAALLGVDACPMEGIEPPKYDEILGLSAQGLTTLCAAAAGYRSAEDKYASAKKVRFKPAEVVQHV